VLFFSSSRQKLDLLTKHGPKLVHFRSFHWKIDISVTGSDENLIFSKKVQKPVAASGAPLL
jgi:hypothetical protein